jgi:cysteine desulfurase
MGATADLYLDWNGSAPLCTAARSRIEGALAAGLGNPSSLHRAGERGRRALEQSRAEVAALLDAAPEELVFTSGGTEANHLAIAGRFERAPPAAHLVTTAIEHASTLAAAERLVARGVAVTHVAPRPDGSIAVADLLAALTPATLLVACMAANNETGALQPIQELAAALRKTGVPLHVDAVQLLGRTPLRVRELGAASASFSGHKLGGPAGAGALWIARGHSLAPYVGGGRQERGRRGGTPGLLSLIGFGAAADDARRRGARLGAADARDAFERDVRAALPEVVIVSKSAARLPNTSLLLLPGCDGGRMVTALAEDGVDIATGSACHAGASEPSHVLRALQIPAALARAAVRFSFGPDDDAAVGEEAARRLLRNLPCARLTAG